MFVDPMELSWGRWRRLSRPRKSLLRDLEHELLTSVRLSGRCLDLGGGEITSYQEYMDVDGVLETVNINPDFRPDMVADLNMPLPIQNEQYDAVISFNTLEHVENDELALREILRVLKPGGGFHLLVPFLYRVHGSPSDYHRHTWHEWDRRLGALGLKLEEYSIQPIVWDVVSTAFATIEVALPRLRWLRWILRPLSLLPGLLYYKVRRRRGAWSNFPLGYYIYGVKGTSFSYLQNRGQLETRGNE